MSTMRKVYLLLTVVGGVVPMYYFVLWFMDHGVSLPRFLAAWMVNDATTGLTFDITFTAFTLTAFILAEVKVRKDYLCLVVLPAIYCVGVSFALPLYLFLRSRNLD